MILERLTPKQRYAVTEMLYENAYEAGAKFVFLDNFPCPECCWCKKDFNENPCSVSAHKCDVCGKVIQFDENLTGKCEDPECLIVRDFYGVKVQENTPGNPEYFYKLSRKKEMVSRRNMVVGFFKKNGVSEDYRFTKILGNMELLLLGMDICETKSEIQEIKTIKKGLNNGIA